MINKGVICAGGSGSRLWPLTKITNKHTIPVWNRQMIFYPLQTLIKSGISNILIVAGKGHAGTFLELLESGEEFGVNLSYTVQEKPSGIADAIRLAKKFVGNDDVVVILGDNIFEDTFDFSNFGEKGEKARIYFKDVIDPWKFGVGRFKNYHKIFSFDKPDLVEIIEKPKEGEEPSNLVQTGLYLYDNSIFDIIDELKPSSRGELEITDVNNTYLRQGELDYEFVDGIWVDAGSSFEDLYEASTFIRASEINREYYQ